MSKKSKKGITNKKKNAKKNKNKPSTTNEYELINFRDPDEFKALPKEPMKYKKYADKKSGEDIAEILEIMEVDGVIPRNKRLLRKWENRQAMADDFRVAVFVTDLKILRKQLESNAIVAFIFFITLGLCSGPAPYHHIQTDKVIGRIKKFRKEKAEIYEKEKKKLRDNDI